MPGRSFGKKEGEIQGQRKTSPGTISLTGGERASLRGSRVTLNRGGSKRIQRKGSQEKKFQCPDLGRWIQGVARSRT